MIKKLLVISISIALIFSFILITKSDKSIDLDTSSQSHLEGSDFTSVKQAYFGEEIVFDATNYVDSQNNIKNYFWDFGDGFTSEGTRVQHTYDFENDYNLEYPIVYSVTVMAYDGYESISTTHLIELYPNTYVFYLNDNQLTDGPPSEGGEYVGTTSIFDEDAKTVAYELENSITIPQSEWIFTICLEKPLLLKINKIDVSFLDENFNEVSFIEKKIGLLSYGRLKTIELKGSFNNKVNLKSVKLTIYGFSIGEQIKILYGGEKASQIVFNFS